MNPLTSEVCDGLDSDYDGNVDEGVLEQFWIDEDGDGHGSDADDSETVMDCFTPDGYADNNDDCDDSEGSINPAWASYATRDIDDNCNGEVDEDWDCTAPIARASIVS